VVGVDGSAASDAAIRWTAPVAVTRSLPTTLAHVTVPTMMSSTTGFPKMERLLSSDRLAIPPVEVSSIVALSPDAGRGSCIYELTVHSYSRYSVGIRTGCRIHLCAN
jgi:nucleotide-binding universal stress UspA family protein